MIRIRKTPRPENAPPSHPRASRVGTDYFADDPDWIKRESAAKTPLPGLRYCYRIQGWVLNGEVQRCGHQAPGSCGCPTPGPHPADCKECH